MIRAKLVKESLELNEFEAGSDFDHYGRNTGDHRDPRNSSPEPDSEMVYEYDPVSTDEGPDLIVTFTGDESGGTYACSWAEVIELIDESEEAWDMYVEPVMDELKQNNGQLSPEIRQRLIDPMCDKYAEILQQKVYNGEVELDNGNY